MNRLTPEGPAHAYKTYEVRRPRATHFRIATCVEVDCPHHIYGWKTVVDMATDLGQRQAKYIAFKSDRKYKATQSGTIITFVFTPGQKCFTEHTVPLEREPLYIVRGGDWRGNPRRVPTVQRKAPDWVDDFANNQIAVKARIERG